MGITASHAAVADMSIFAHSGRLTRWQLATATGLRIRAVMDREVVGRDALHWAHEACFQLNPIRLANANRRLTLSALIPGSLHQLHVPRRAGNASNERSAAQVLDEARPPRTE